MTAQENLAREALADVIESAMKEKFDIGYMADAILACLTSNEAVGRVAKALYPETSGDSRRLAVARAAILAALGAES